MNNITTNMPIASVPQNADLEAGVIGAVLRDADFYHDVSWLKEEMFYTPAHAKLWRVIADRIKADEPIDPVFLSDYAEASPEIKEWGGAEYLTKLIFEEFSIIDPMRYARHVQEMYQKRRLLKLFERCAGDCMEQEEPHTFEEIVAKIQAQLIDIDVGKLDAPLSFADVLEASLASLDDIRAGKTLPSLSSGFSGIDLSLGGLGYGHLVVLAARPGMGKTALALNMAVNVAKRLDGEEYALFISLEMPKKELANRILASESNIDHGKIKSGGVSAKERDALEQTKNNLSNLRLKIADDNSVSAIDQMVSHIRREYLRGGLRAVFVDYLQLIDREGTNENRTLQLAYITRSLKRVARECNLPVVALSQLSREVERREGAEPVLSDLRDSGAIEQDADSVMFIHRPEYYLKDVKPKAGESTTDFRQREDEHLRRKNNLRGMASLIIAKNRHGATGKRQMSFTAPLMKFRDE